MKKSLLLVFTATLMMFLTTNVMAQNGKMVKVSNNSELIQALNDPSVTSVEITQSGYYDELGAEVNAGNVITFAEFTGGSRGSCTLEITKTDVCFNADGTPTSNVAIAATSGDPSCPAQPTSGAYGWSSPQAGTTLTFVPTLNMYEYTMNFEVTAPGFYTLTYKWNDFDLTTTQVVFYSTPEITFTNDPSSCETIVIAYTINAGTPSGGTYTEVWEVTDGNSTTVTMTTPSGSPFTFDPADYIGDMLWQCGTYTIDVTVTNPGGPGCPNTESTTFYLYDKPTGVSAGADQPEVCAVGSVMSTSLSGSFTTVSCDNSVTPTVAWTQTGGSGTAIFTAPTANATDVSVDICGTYEFTYTVTNGDCSTPSTTSVTFYDLPTLVNAGTDQSVCEDSNGDFLTTLDGSFTNSSCGGTNDVLWTQYSGPATATITNETSLTPSIDAPECGTYVFQMDVTNGSDCTVSSTVTVDFYDLAKDIDAGLDQEVCENGSGEFTTTVEGSYTSSSCGTNTVLWTVSSSSTGTGTITFGTPTDNYTTVTSTACGEYILDYTITTGGPTSCEVVSSTTVYFYDLPENVSAGTEQDVCEDATDGYTADLSGSYDAVTCGTPTVGWTKVSGPGSVIFDPVVANIDDVTITASECGTYVFAYEVTNGPSCSVSNTVTVNFYDVPTDLEITTDDKVCGYTSDLLGEFVVSCDNGTTPTMAWTVTPATGVTFGTGTASSTTVTVPTCGEYTFTYTVTNLSGCETSTSKTVTFYETPDITVAQGTPAGDVYTCSEVTYTVTNAACGADLWDYSWIVAGGSIVGSTTGTTITVAWDQNPGVGAGTVTCTANTIDLADCEDTDALSVDLVVPTLEGQVKYWNAFETYMPTPFPTDLYGTFPEDYFYVTLYVNYRSTYDSIETVIVQPNLLLDINGNDSTLMSYFGFDINTLDYGCAAQYVVKIWDGGLVYHGTVPTNSPTYLGAAYTYNEWGGVNATDALGIQMMANDMELNTAWPWVGLQALVPEYGYYSNEIADVNNTATITALDALTAKYRTVGLLAKYPDNGSSNMYRPNFAVTGRMVSTLPDTTFSDYFDVNNADDIQFAHSGADYQYFDAAVDHKYTSENLPWEGKKNFMNIYYEAIGDINASYVPTSAGFKAEPAMELLYEGLVSSDVESVMTIPVNIDRDAELGAITLSFNFRNDLIEVLGTNFNEDDVYINQEEGILNMAWYSLEAIDVTAEVPVAQIKVRVLAEIPANTELFELNVNTELADATATPIADINLKTIGVTTDKGAFNATELEATNYPNPFSDATTISYTLPEAGKVTVEVYNNMGMKVKSLISETQEAGVHNINFSASDAKPGVYFYHITVQGETKNFSTVKRMIVTQ